MAAQGAALVLVARAAAKVPLPQRRLDRGVRRPVLRQAWPAASAA
ncbi:hypothetical protein BZL29_4388 [Mycobacterium kansasii]|uniref:Uncharacterized protein n=1 Tax=Mycobacterium kansasii TaxID=1768 RepID=A0A1V3X5Y7_MYCKA|nr:hypothetical protein BZL29_4388 [Mycobacterium kansasii]